MTKDVKCNSGVEVEHCIFCGRSGHNKEGCFKRIGYPEWWLGKGKKDKGKPKAAMANVETRQVPIMTDEQYQGLLKYFTKDTRINTEPTVNMTGKEKGNSSWIIDTGATNHMTCDRNLFETKVPCDYESPVVIPNGEMIPVEGK